MDCHEAWAEPLDAGVILVAVGLIDLAFAAKRGFQRLNGNAVRGNRAVAATFANGFVDEDALWRIGI